MNLRKMLTVGLMFLSFSACYSACSANMSVHKNGHGTTNNDDFIDLNVESNDQFSYCITSTAADVTTSRPVDVIFVIDNSGSMTEEIASVVKNINEHFVDEMVKAGLDYRVIMIVIHGESNQWGNTACFEEPLSTIPKGGCATIGNNPPGNNPGKFYHYSYDVQSNDSPCIILDTLTASNNRPDTFGLAPGGWIKWLRKSAFKVFVEVTDDMPSCWWYPDASKPNGKKVFNDFASSLGGQIMALEFDKTLTKLHPEQFGTQDKRNYVFYSIVGMSEKPIATDDDTGLLIDPAGKPEDPFVPSEGITGDLCSTAVSPGFGYQWLSKLTGGLRFPVCQADKFDVVFEKIASSIDSITSTTCVIDLPAVGSEGVVNVDTVEIEVEESSGDTIKLKKVASSAECTGSGDEFYVDVSSFSVNLCPTACIEIKSTAKEVRMTAACSPVVD